MATRYRIVEEGRAVYIERRGWLFWSRLRKKHSPSSAWTAPITTDWNFHTVEAAKAEIDRRLSFEAGWEPRVTNYPPA